MTNKCIKKDTKTLSKAIKIAIISFALSFLFFVIQLMAVSMYYQTDSDKWSYLILALLAAMAFSIVIISATYFGICKKKKVMPPNIVSTFIIADIVYVGLMLIVFPMIYKVFDQDDWGLVAIQGAALIIAGIWLFVLVLVLLLKKAGKQYDETSFKKIE